jgi:hypothetical protein
MAFWAVFVLTLVLSASAIFTWIDLSNVWWVIRRGQIKVEQLEERVWRLERREAGLPDWTGPIPPKER